MPRTHDPRHPITPAPTPDPEEQVVRPDDGRPHLGRLLLAVAAVVGVALLGWFFFVYAEPVADGPAAGEIEQEEDDAIDSTDG